MHLLFGFEGRVGRLSWWLGELVAFSVVVIGIVIAVMTVDHGPDGKAVPSLSTAIVVLSAIALGTWIRVSVTVKRYHDRGKGGVWFLVVFIPIIGPLWQLIECGFLPGTEGPNAYGPDPLA